MIKTIYFIFFICAFSHWDYGHVPAKTVTNSRIFSDQFEEMIQDKTIRLITHGSRIFRKAIPQHQYQWLTMSLAQTSRSFFKRPSCSRLLQKGGWQCGQYLVKKDSVYNLDKVSLDWKELGKENKFLTVFSFKFFIMV